jgi:hypothetical protein
MDTRQVLARFEAASDLPMIANQGRNKNINTAPAFVAVTRKAQRSTST